MATCPECGADFNTEDTPWFDSQHYFCSQVCALKSLAPKGTIPGWS